MNEKRRLGFILGLYILFAFTYSVLMPPWEGPDEPAHYILAVNLARVGVFSSIERNYEAGQPQPYYRMMSVPLKLLYIVDREWVAVIQPERNYGNVRVAAPIFQWSDENYQFLPGMYLLRWINILMGGGALGLNYVAMRRFAGSGWGPLSALALAALTPQFLHTTSSVANDTLGILAGAFLFWLMSRMSRQVSLWELAVMLVLAFLLPYTTKLTVLPVGIASAITVIIHIRELWPGGWRKLAIGGLAVGGSALLLSLVLFPQMGELFLQQIGWRAFTINKDSLTLKYLSKMVTQVVWSYWGLVGWLAVGLPGWVVVLLTGWGVVGAGAGMIRKREEKQGNGGVGKMWMVWLVGGLAVAAVLKNGLNTVNTQGRFLFPAIGALALLAVSGWERLLPARFRPYLLPGVMSLMIGANLILWFGGIIPVYYQPFLD